MFAFHVVGMFLLASILLGSFTFIDICYVLYTTKTPSCSTLYRPISTLTSIQQYANYWPRLPPLISIPHTQPVESRSYTAEGLNCMSLNQSQCAWVHHSYLLPRILYSALVWQQLTDKKIAFLYCNMQGCAKQLSRALLLLRSHFSRVRLCATP